MENLFYSPRERILFLVAGYTDKPTKDNVKEIINILKSNTKKLAGVISACESRVYTFLVDKSRIYKNMRVFYIKTNMPPIRDEAFVISENTTMRKYLND